MINNCDNIFVRDDLTNDFLLPNDAFGVHFSELRDKFCKLDKITMIL